MNVVELHAANDDEALRQALQFRADDALELWSSGRKIILIYPASDDPRALGAPREIWRGVSHKEDEGGPDARGGASGPNRAAREVAAAIGVLLGSLSSRHKDRKLRRFLLSALRAVPKG